MEGDEINQRKLIPSSSGLMKPVTGTLSITALRHLFRYQVIRISQQIPALLYEMGKQLVIHISIVGAGT